MSRYLRFMWMNHLIVLRAKFSGIKGQMSLLAVVGCVILLVAYMIMPETFHEFIRHIINTFKEAMDRSFSGYGGGGPPEDDGRLAGGSK